MAYHLARAMLCESLWAVLQEWLLIHGDRRLAYRAGVTKGISAPAHRGFYAGLGTTFFTGATNRLDKGAVVQETTAVHITVRPELSVSVSTQIATLRRMLLHPVEGDAGDWFRAIGEVSVLEITHCSPTYSACIRAV